MNLFSAAKSSQQKVPKVRNVPNAMDESLRRKEGVESNSGNVSILYLPAWPFVPKSYHDLLKLI